MSQNETNAIAARKVIDRIRIDTGYSGNKLRVELRKNYPFGVRAGSAYKVWLNEVAEVCGRSRLPKSQNMDMFIDGK